jgi:gluconolactonase
VPDVDLADLVAGTAPEAVASGFAYTEGPVWLAEASALLFHDIPSDRRLRWSERDGLQTVAQPTRKGNGMTLDREGRLLVCESAAHRVVRHEPDGRVTVLAERYEGRELNSPNDIVVRSDGDVYFTDPAYGRIPVYGVERPRELDVQGLFRIRARDGALELLCDDFAQPNGLCFSPDERRLYVNDTERAEVRAFDVAEDGTLRGDAILHAPVGPALAFEDARRNLLPRGFVDGMKCDALGNVYVTGPGGIWVLDPDGRHVGIVELSEDVANFTWGGDDGLSLFCCCRSALVRVAMRVRGAA